MDPPRIPNLDRASTTDIQLNTIGVHVNSIEFPGKSTGQINRVHSGLPAILSDPRLAYPRRVDSTLKAMAPYFACVDRNVSAEKKRGISRFWMAAGVLPIRRRVLRSRGVPYENTHSDLPALAIARSRFPSLWRRKSLPPALFGGSHSRIRRIQAKASATGQGVDAEAFDWLLAQVDFVVDVVGSEDLILSDEQRSQLLQLLLDIANLNEYIPTTPRCASATQVTGYPGGTQPLPRTCASVHYRFKMLIYGKGADGCSASLAEGLIQSGRNTSGPALR